MGYYVHIQESTFQIPAENLEEAYNRMCQLNFTVPNNHKRGGSWGGSNGKDSVPEYGPHVASWFSWMNWDYHETCKDADAILNDLGFETHYDSNGNLLIDGYDSKTGQEDLFLKSICDLSKGYIIWKGEDDEVWGETYGGKSVVVKTQTRQDYMHLVDTELMGSVTLS